MYSSTPCSTSSCTTSPYVIFETNSLPYVQRTVVTERNQSNSTSCIDDSGGGETPVDNNNIGDDDNDNHGTDHILKRISASVLQRHSFEHVADNENDEDEDDTSQGKLWWSFNQIFYTKVFIRVATVAVVDIAEYSDIVSTYDDKHWFVLIPFFFLERASITSKSSEIDQMHFITTHKYGFSWNYKASSNNHKKKK